MSNSKEFNRPANCKVSFVRGCHTPHPSVFSSLTTGSVVFVGFVPAVWKLTTNAVLGEIMLYSKCCSILTTILDMKSTRDKLIHKFL